MASGTASAETHAWRQTAVKEKHDSERHVEKFGGRAKMLPVGGCVAIVFRTFLSYLQGPHKFRSYPKEQP